MQGFLADNATMQTDSSHDLVGTLHKRAQDAANGPRQPDYRARAYEAAFAQGSDERAWSRVRLAADLRADGEKEAALRVLDEAWMLGASEDAERAIYTVAIALHCDLVLTQLPRSSAQSVEQPQSECPVVKSSDFARASARLYSELFKVTEDDEHRRRWEHYAAIAGKSAGAASALAA